MNILFFLTPKSEVEYIDGDASLLETVRKMCEKGYSAIPIIGKSGEYIGTIQSGDILAFINNNLDLSLTGAEKIQLSDIKRTRDNIAISINSRMEDIVEKILNQNFVPVIDDCDKFIGIITRKDVIKYLCENTEKMERRSQIDD